MKRIFPLMLLAALAAPGCSLLKPTPKTPAPAPTSSASGAPSSDRNQNYVNQYQSAAIMESQTGGVPASITLAQGILESGAGTSELAQNANNHFGVKCGNNWTGKTYMKKDDDKDASGKLVESCFRKYDKVEDSYFDHAAFLHDPKKESRYGFLFKLDKTDYKGWAHGLQSSGYSTSNTYADKLIDLIERYKLYEYDQPGGGQNIVPNPENVQAGAVSNANIPLPNSANRVGRVNNVRVILARENESISDIAKVYRLTPENVAKYNDQNYTIIQKLALNTRIFIQSKKSKWSGTGAEHTVKQNETTFDIAQNYGIKLDNLLQRNRLGRGQQPAVGERIYLNTNRPKDSEVRLSDNTSTTTQTQTTAAGTTATMTPDQDGLLDEISGGGQNTPPPTTATTPPPPAATTPPPTAAPPPAVAPAATTPAVSGTGYPSSSGSVTAQPTPAPPPAAVPDGYHLVVKGDTLSSIARKYNTTNARIKQLNNMTEDSVKLGQTLKVK